MNCYLVLQKDFKFVGLVYANIYKGQILGWDSHFMNNFEGDPSYLKMSITGPHSA